MRSGNPRNEAVLSAKEAGTKSERKK